MRTIIDAADDNGDDALATLDPEAESLAVPETTRCHHGAQLRPMRAAFPQSFAEAVYGYDPHVE